MNMRKMDHWNEVQYIKRYPELDLVDIYLKIITWEQKQIKWFSSDFKKNRVMRIKISVCKRVCVRDRESVCLCVRDSV